MPILDVYTLDNYRLDGSSNDLNTRTAVIAKRDSNYIGNTDTSLYTALMPITIPAMNKFLDVYSTEPDNSISRVGTMMMDVYFVAGEAMYFSTSDFTEVCLLLTDNKNENFRFFSSKRMGEGYSGVTPSIQLELYSLWVDKENRKLCYTGFKSSGGTQPKQVTTVDIPTSFNLDGVLTFKIGAQKSYTTGGTHTLTVERRALNVITS
ncbi:hypothetical protein ABGV43_27750 [Paenibacillus amylolyticus]|uniref:hypothetical protein n=1 Tax=Paenibacillus amylolyticus TaxID=1451 RepID=UPI003242BD27